MAEKRAGLKGAECASRRKDMVSEEQQVSEELREDRIEAEGDADR